MIGLKYFEINKLHGYKKVKLELKNDVLILVGENGSGKTTILRILYHFISGDWLSLTQYPFESITVDFEDQEKVEIYKNDLLCLLHLPAPISRRILNTNHLLDIKTDELYDFLRHYDNNFIEHKMISSLSDENILSLDENMLSFDEKMVYYRKTKDKPAETKKLFIKIQKIRNVLKKVFADCIIIYLPTYRRIERELKKILSNIDENELRKKYAIGKKNFLSSKNSDFIRHFELVEFGMSDVEESINGTLEMLKGFAIESLNKLTIQYLGDVVDEKYRDVDIAMIKNATDETISNVLGRIDDKILTDDSKDRLSETIDQVRADPQENQKLNEHDKVICHYFTKLLNFQQVLEEKEKQIRGFCDVCNSYMEDKFFEYVSSSFSFIIKSRLPHVDKEQISVMFPFSQGDITYSPPKKRAFSHPLAEV